jgi:hypothetical protein
MPLRDPQPTDTGFELTMLGAGDVGKFVGVATAGRWTPSSRFALRDALVARRSSRSAARAFAVTAIATMRVEPQLVWRRNGPRVLGTSNRPRGLPITASAIASSACANAQYRA